MNMLSIFKDISHIPGLEYKESYITRAEEELLLKLIDNNPWMNDLKRRVQHYGYKYDYKSRSIDQSHYLGAIPIGLQNLCDRLYKEGIFSAKPDQVIVNEYMEGQGIAKHIDCIPCFSETICSLSLGSHCIMDFILPTNGFQEHIMLKPRSLLILKDEARYKWQHGIDARKSDKYQGITYPRKRRVSLTFRKVIYNN